MIIFDLDGTLADCEHRRHFVDPRKRDCKCGNKLNHICYKCKHWQPDWPAFYEACDKDEPIHIVIEVFKSISDEHEVQIWSGRCESVRGKTIEWLCNNGIIPPLHVFELKMRPIGDNTPDEVLKERWLDEAMAAGNKIDFVFDDRPKAVRMWHRRGIFVFNCLQHDNEF